MINKKCKGCGVVLNTNKNTLGYTPKIEEKTTLCQRCFKLKHYNQLTNDHQQNLDITVDDVFSKIDFSNLRIFMIVDILDLEHTIIESLNQHNDNIVFVVNKMDLLPKSYNADLVDENVKLTIKKYNYYPQKLIYCSTKNKTSIKKLMNFVENATKNKQKSIFIGKSNVGKSSLLNALLKLNNSSQQLTVSSYTNTTLNINKIVVNKNIILDTPGISFKANALNYLNPKDNKHVMISYDSKFINYQLQKNQSVFISGLAVLNYLDGEDTTINFYVGNEVDLLRCKLENAQSNFENRYINTKFNYEDKNAEFQEYVFELDPNKKHNINIAGLAMIVVSKNAKKISIKTHSEVSVKLCSYAII